MRISKILDDSQVDEILHRARNGESISSLAEEYEIGKTTIRDWITGRHRTGKDFNPEKMTLAEHQKIKKLEKENKSLYEIIGQLTTELKKQKDLLYSN
jgi:transposase-like protein